MKHGGKVVVEVAAANPWPMGGHTLTLVFSDSVTTLGRKVMEQQGGKVS